MEVENEKIRKKSKKEDNEMEIDAARNEER